MIERSVIPKTKIQLLAHYDKVQLSQAQKRITQKVQLQLREKKSTNISNLILNTLKNHFIFYNLSDNQLENIKDKMLFCVVQQNNVVYQEGSVGECFFIVQSGQLQMTQQGKFKRQLKPPTGFGEIALLYSTQRTNAVIAVTKSELWVIDRNTFRSAVQEVIIRQYNENRKCLQGVRFFSQLSQQQKDIVASTLIVQKFYKNQNVVQEGDPGSSLYFIKDGSVSVYKGQKFIRKLGRGDSFGEQSLYYNTMRQFTIKADEQVTCLVLGRDTLNRILGDKIYDVTFKNFIKWSFEKNKIMSKLSKNNALKIIEEMNISSFKANESIFRKGTLGFQKLVVIIEGGLKNLKNGVIVANKGQCYGQEYLLSVNKNKTLQDQIVTTTYSVIAQIGSHQLFEVIENLSFEDVIKKDEQKRSKQFIKYDNTAWKNKAKKYSISQFNFVQQIAKGQFGQIFLVTDPDNNLYALKSYQKKQIYQYDVDKFIVDEKNVLQKVNHPFIVGNVLTFQTQNVLFFLNELIFGVNFQQGLKEIGLLSTEDSQFYTANIILILQYLQESAIICRDIKPQNFMIDERGYLKLMSLCTAKISRSETNQLLKTYTIIGTPHYMAPDIILGKGYNNLVDLWSLGVCLYEFLSGVLPYGDSADGAYEIYEEIMKGQLRFPEFITDRKAKKLIQQLLSHNPEQRHGGSFNILKANPFFQNFDWDQFYQPQGKPLIIEPPFPPNKNKQLIIANARMACNNIVDTIKNLDKIHPVDKQIDHDPFQDFGDYLKY